MMDVNQLELYIAEIQQYANIAGHYADLFDQGITITDEVSAVIDAVIGVTAVITLGVAAETATVAGAAEIYYFADVRPLATRTRDYLREVRDYLNEVVEKINDVDALGKRVLDKLEQDISDATNIPKDKIKKAVDSAEKSLGV